MTTCNCIVQAGQISGETQAGLRSRLDAFSQASFGSPAEIGWVEIAPGSGYTATQPSTSSIVSLTADKPLEQSERIPMLRDLCDLWSAETGCSLDEIVGVINDPA
ncbi:hypothetical protein SAMN02745824_2961 [Parasphingorhabdus marina DSM 22363]|uniref:Uncharacterized protein n=1 Tax=Parasphingorhabdus marina DSM 22363 TaxID=1123272 RepID=A0A1N6GST1_9SPHN|nr:hypothetical protein [Parasphingorhabdus marina]SIO10415.1 hypothetical protein SAMN02745824_2961 [Parasphingorhabdus marina DSM 22363]